MPFPTEMLNKITLNAAKKLVVYWQWLVLLLSALILCFTVILAIYKQAHTTGPIAPVEPKQIQSAKSGQAQLPDTTIPAIWPTKGAITSGFGWRNSPFGGQTEMHAGVDIATAMEIPVVATADGKVTQCGLYGDYGNIVLINHGNGIETIYGHNSQIAVSVGQSVTKGQVISYAGSTGKSTGPHVHYEIRVNGSAVDPIKFMVLY